MWRPGFDFLEQCPALLNGYHRSFCIYSHHHRGTAKTPGLVLGLNAGGDCHGVAFRVSRDNARQVVAYLDERELSGDGAYIPTFSEVCLERHNGCTPEPVTAYTYVANTAHFLFAGEIMMDRAAKLIMNAQGISGLNRDYLMNTVHHLEQVGYSDETLHILLRRVEYLTGTIDMGGGI
jgi:cation transport protein ChaC